MDLKNPEEAFYVMSLEVFAQKLTNGIDRRVLLEALAEGGFLKFDEGDRLNNAPRYTCRMSMGDGRRPPRRVAIRADAKTGTICSMKDNDEDGRGPELKIVRLSDATDNPLRAAAIDQNGGL